MYPRADVQIINLIFIERNQATDKLEIDQSLQMYICIVGEQSP